MTKPTVSKQWRKPVGRQDQAWIIPEPLHHVTIIQETNANDRNTGRLDQLLRSLGLTNTVGRTVHVVAMLCLHHAAAPAGSEILMGARGLSHQFLSKGLYVYRPIQFIYSCIPEQHKLAHQPRQQSYAVVVIVKHRSTEDRRAEYTKYHAYLQQKVQQKVEEAKKQSNQLTIEWPKCIIPQKYLC